jgi:hypothetical protein
MTGRCITGPLHTLDMIERPFYIPRTHAQSYSPVPPRRDQSQRRRPAISILCFPAPLRAFFPRSDSNHPLQQEVLAKRDLYESVVGPDREVPAPPLGSRPTTQRGAGRIRRSRPYDRKQTLGGPPRAVGTQEDEE